MLKTEIPYPENDDPGCLFAKVEGQPWSVWLDSGTDESRFGRYDIIVAEPRLTLETQGEKTFITSIANGTVTVSDEDPFILLRRFLTPATAVKNNDLPFSGGALGYFAYDLARRLETLPTHALDDLALPEMAVGIYDWALVCDRQEKRCWLTTSHYRDEGSLPWQRLVARFSDNPMACPDDAPMHAVGPVTSNLTAQGYAEAFSRIQHYLEEGDCYQVNFAQRFCVDVSGSAWGGYRQLRNRSSGPFSAYMNIPSGQILCTSPERFLRLRNGQVQTRPIKGTRRRDLDAEIDSRLRDELHSSEKDRAENLMIVDLLRNDLGKSCRTGTVQVPELFSVESFATVHHLVSSITCELDEGNDALSMLRGCFPGGSITGAPKLRAMEIIEELEPHRRSVYCGSIGYIGFDGNMDCNIVIRTAIHHAGRLYYSAGGGIVRDSSCEEEYQESFDKAAAFLNCFTV